MELLPCNYGIISDNYTLPFSFHTPLYPDCMDFHEKSLELNITHELLNLADSWYWFLTDIPLWRYWKPKYRLPYLKVPKSTSGGFHITTEGKDDPTGESGGGFDVRIKTGLGNHLLFIQFKKGQLSTKSPDATSEFSKAPHEHFVFEINGTTTNQHFTLRKLAAGKGAEIGNAVVYAFPLINDMDELEANAGKLIRKTKFVSVADIDKWADIKKCPFKVGEIHNFRVGAFDMNRCDINFFFFFYGGPDRTPEIVADIICIGFEKILSYFLAEAKISFKKFELFDGYIPSGLQQAFIQYARYLLHYFEVSPGNINFPFLEGRRDYFINDEFEGYQNKPRDVEIVNAVFTALRPFETFIFKIKNENSGIFNLAIPEYEPQFLITLVNNNGLVINFNGGDSEDIINELSYLVI